MTSLPPHLAPPKRSPEQRLALVTGASRGLGSAVARHLAPTHSLLLGGRESPELDAQAVALDGASTFCVDLTDYEAVAALTESIDQLDVLVHSAGVASVARIEDSSVDQWRYHFEVNLLAVFELTRLLLPALRAGAAARPGGGHVVFVNSGAGKRPSEGLSAYSASKFGLTSFAEALRLEEPSLRVTSIFPGRIDTDMQRDLVAMRGEQYDAARNLRPDTVAAAIAAAVATAPDGHPQEIVLRPQG